MDEQGGSNFKAMGHSQLLSVPYALYAERSGSRENDMDWGKRMNDKLDIFTGTGGSYPDGNVGIGTFIPKAKLEVAYQYGIGSSFMRVNNTPASNSIFLMRRSKGDIKSKTEVVDGDFIGQVAFEGYDGTTFKRSARMSSQVDGAVQPGIVPGNIIFHTRNTAGVMNEIIRFTIGGNVGIGTTDPQATLDIIGNMHLFTGTSINEFSTDTTLSGNSNDTAPTEKAIKTYVDNEISTSDSLSNGMIWIGDANGLSQEHTMSSDVTITNAGVTTIGVGKVVNNMLAGSITDNKLNTITTGGKVANSATTATPANTINTIVLRDGSGNFNAGAITADGIITSGSSIIIDGTGTTQGLITESHGKISFDDEDLVTMGNVGIGTTTPSGILDIAGAYHFPDTDGSSGQVLQTNGSGTLSWNNKSTTYSVGDFARAGIVFWVDETGQHGLVCAKEDQSTGIRWTATTGAVSASTQAKGDGPLAGKMNTSIIISAYVSIGDDGSTYAARICNELQITEYGKIYGDWYLPSKEEVNLMYQNRTAINATAVANGGNAFSSSNYWSSTEYDMSYTWRQSFSDGYQSIAIRILPNRVRAIRSF